MFVPHSFATEEGGSLLTDSFKLRRHNAKLHFVKEIEELYAMKRRRWLNSWNFQIFLNIEFKISLKLIENIFKNWNSIIK